MDDTQVFEMTLGGHTVRAELMHNRAPRISAAFLRHLPVESFAVHAKFAGEELIAMVPFFEAQENEVPSVSPGDIGYYPTRQSLCLFYGDIVPFASISLFARVLPEDLETAQTAGREVLAGGAAPVRFASTRGAAGSPPTATGATAGDLRGLVLRALDDIWTSEPLDTRQLREFSRPPMGNMPGVLYANFDLFWIVENLLVFRDLASDAALPPSQLARVMAAMLRRTQSRLAHWGFPQACALLESVAAGLERQQPRQTRLRLLALIEALVLYTDRLQSWIDAMVPWAEMDRSLRLLPPDRLVGQR